MPRGEVRVAIETDGRPEGLTPRPSIARLRRPIPAVVMRNTVLLALTQAFVGTGTQLVPTLGGLMIERLLGSLALAGLGTSMLHAARLLIAYPVGWVTDAHGRKVGLLLGLVLSLVGAVMVGAAMLWASFPLFLTGLLVFGSGVGAGQQLRTAAADMYLPERRGEGLGYVLTGSLVGALGGPVLIAAAQRGSGALRLDAVALAWLLVPAVLVPSMALVFLIRPDPKVIAADLGRFYPGYRPPEAEPGGTGFAGRVGLRAWLAHAPLRLAFLAMFAAHGTMTMMMALTPLSMSHRGHGLTLISVAVSLHVVGMFGLSVPLGRLADRIGHRAVILGGLGVVVVGTALVPTTSDYGVATLGLALVGVGWSGVNVAVTAIVADAVPVAARGRAVGVVDSASSLASIALPLAGGPLAEVAGFSALIAVAVVLALVPAWLALRMAEPSAAATTASP
jgi:MFS family permease